MHPDFNVANRVMRPDNVDTTTFEHVMLVQAARANETSTAPRVGTLIEETVFQREELLRVEQIQRGPRRRE